jgi:hypothetical protein
MPLIFGDKESIEKVKKINEWNNKRERQWKESGLSWEKFVIREELKWWGVED